MADNKEAAAASAELRRSSFDFSKAEALPNKVRRSGVRRRLFEFFNSGPGHRIAGPLIDVHFRFWTFRHGASTFGEYYARSIALKLKRGGTHKTLGGKTFLSGSPFAAPKDSEAAEFSARGRRYLEAAVKAGLRPHHVCADYGCGSLRVGQHLIGYLDRDNYWGLDIVSDFYEAGLPLLPVGLVASKRPQFRIIGPETAGELAAAAPDFIVSFAVMKHVPPRELACYFAGIATPMMPGARALITFREGRHSQRVGAKIWTHDSATIAATLRAVDASLGHAIYPLGKPGEGKTFCLMLWRDAADRSVEDLATPACCRC